MSTILKLPKISSFFLLLIACVLLSPIAKSEIIMPDKIEATFTVDHATANAFNAHITLYNGSASPLNNWAMGLTFQRVITNVTGAKLLKQIGDYYIFIGDEANKSIPPGGSTTFNIQGNYTIRNYDDAPKGYFIVARDDKNKENKPIEIPGKTVLLPVKSAPGPDEYALTIKKDIASIEGNPVPSSHPLESSLIVPFPVQLQLGSGEFILKPDTLILVDNTDAMKEARFLQNSVQPPTGYFLNVQTRDKNQNTPLPPNSIYLTSNNASSDLGTEGYTLEVTPSNIIIHANSGAGFFYGIQSMRQLLPPQIFSNQRKLDVVWKIPSINIKDYPRFAYRGVMLDVARHFFTAEQVKRLLDLMALHKLNTFRWHLTDDEGWRIEIKKYPELTEKGAWRGYDETLPPALGSGIKRYGGYYTQDQIRDIINYANERHITIIPEIDMPAHARAMIKSLPGKLVDSDDKTQYSSTDGFHDNVLSPCMDSTFKVVTNILDEVSDLFPGKYIHVGSNEIPRNVWENSPKCIALLDKLNLVDTDQLQNYFSKRVQTILANKHKSIGGWEEIIKEGNLDLNLQPLIYSVTDDEHGAQAAKLGYDVVMSPAQYLNLGLAYGPDPQEPGAYWPDYVDTFRVYSYRPVIVKRVPADIVAKIKGIEGVLWSEFIDSPERLDYFAFPKIAALAEVAWTPASTRNWQNFSARLGFQHLPRLDNYGVLYRLSPPGISMYSRILHANVEFPGLALRYTLDGTDPAPNSLLYTKPESVSSSKVKMRTFDTNQRGCKVVTE